MARREKMDEAALAALADGEITDARQFATSDLLWGRDKALEYARGEISDIPAEPGKSSVTSRDLSDHLSWIMPGLLRVFLASDKVAVFEPTKEVMGIGAAGEAIDLAAERAAQATNYLNYVFLSECGGYRVLHSAFTDGLLLGNGILKHWWDGTPDYKTESFTGLSDDQFAYLLSHPEVEAALEHSERREALPGGQGAEAVATLHDCKIKRRVTSGRLRVEALPPEEFLIERGAKALDESARFCAHHYQETRSRLIERGYDRATINGIGESASATAFGSLSQSRDGGFLAHAAAGGPDRSTELVDVYECYVLCDYDGDGIAERRRVVMAGGVGRLHILDNEEWSDDLPFSDLATTFNLPDCQGRVTAMLSASTGRLPGYTALGAAGGATTHTLSVSEMPAHAHPIAIDAVGDHAHSYIRNDGDTTVQAGGGASSILRNINGASTSPAGAHTHTATLSNTGGGAAHNNVQPTIAFNKIIFAGV